MDDRQLGERLASALPESMPINAQQVITVLHDLLPPQDPRLKPLEDLARQPEFLALVTPSQEHQPLQGTKETLVQSTRAHHGQAMAESIKGVLDGVMVQVARRSRRGMDPTPVGATDAGKPVSTTEWQYHWEWWHKKPQPPAPTPEATAPQDLEMRETEPPQQPPRRRGWWLVGSVITIGALGALALTALRGDHFCGSLGICSLTAIRAASSALAEAEQTASRLNTAPTLHAYEKDIKELKRQLRALEKGRAINAAQRTSLRRLQQSVARAQTRLEREHAALHTLREVRAESKTLKILPQPQSEEKRRQLLKRLQEISSDSFSREESQALQRKLDNPGAFRTHERRPERSNETKPDKEKNREKDKQKEKEKERRKDKERSETNPLSPKGSRGGGREGKRQKEAAESTASDSEASPNSQKSKDRKDNTEKKNNRQ